MPKFRGPKRKNTIILLKSLRLGRFTRNGARMEMLLKIR